MFRKFSSELTGLRCALLHRCPRLGGRFTLRSRRDGSRRPCNLRSARAIRFATTRSRWAELARPTRINRAWVYVVRLKNFFNNTRVDTELGKRRLRCNGFVFVLIRTGVIRIRHGVAFRWCRETRLFRVCDVQPTCSFRPAAYLTSTTPSNVSINRIAMTHARAKRIVVGFGL